MADDGDDAERRRQLAETAAARAKFRLLNGLPLTTGQVAMLAGCDPKTVTNWIRTKKVEGIQTPGGHWLVSAAEVRRVILGEAAA